jgi:hypothetical protein
LRGITVGERCGENLRNTRFVVQFGAFQVALGVDFGVASCVLVAFCPHRSRTMQHKQLREKVALLRQILEVSLKV